MNSLSSVETRLPPGFRFHPRDEELICDYLMKRVTGCTPHHTPFLIEVDLNKCEPWDIPEIACVGGKDWYFYSQRDRKYATGLRTNRATFSGYWKATGKDRPVIQKGTLVGMRKTLVFYQGRAPKGRKTDWVMHEFRLDGKFGHDESQLPSSIQEDWVLCKVFYKNTSDQVPAKQDIKSTCNSSSSSSPPISLPPLMEPYITFDQIQANYYKYQQQQQVSCFSIFNSNYQTLPSFSLPSTDQIDDQELLPTKIPPNYNFFGGLYNHNSQLLNPNCDKNVIKAVLDHLSKMESCNDNILGEAISDTSNLSDYGLSSIWEDCRYDF